MFADQPAGKPRGVRIIFESSLLLEQEERRGREKSTLSL